MRLLVTGASGFLGWNLCRIAPGAGWETVSAFHSHPVEFEGARSERMDLTDELKTRGQIELLRPDAIIHVAALCQAPQCEQEPSLSQAINVDTPARLASICRRLGIRLIFTSSDLVFDGRNPPYDESSATSPLSVYGRHKVEAESAVLSEFPDALVCRMPLMFGDAGPVARTHFTDLVERLRRGSAASLFEDEFRSMLGGRSAAKALLHFAGGSASGILHLGGRERLSRFEFGVKVARAMGAPSQLIRPSRQTDTPTSPARPPDVTLLSEKARGLGFAPLTVDDELRELFSSF